MAIIIRHFLIGTMLCASAEIVRANATPAYGPPPAWVKPVALPPMTVKGDAPVRLLLSDEQIDFSHSGLAHYGHVVMAIQAAAGLPAANINLPWRPDIDTMTIHTLAIHRGAKTIDVLADQKFAIIRREQKLEAATLDGRLTATLQIAGVEVGDVIELAVTVVSRDPTLGDHAEGLFAQWNGSGFDHAHARLHWSKDIALRFRSSTGLPPLKTVADGSGKTVELSADDVKPLIPPKGAPARFAYGRRVEASDYRSWSEPAAVMAPLYVKASTVDSKGALAAQIATIRAASSDPKTRAAAALALVQDKIRYVALLMGASGYVPAQADATWASKLGDCKAKTAMLLAILHRLDIAAVPALISSQRGDGLDQSLPMIEAFDHVLVRATIDGKDYWLDGTRTGDRDLASIEVPDFGWALPVLPSGSQLVRLTSSPPAAPYTEFRVSIDARAGIFSPAPAHEVLFRGDSAQSTKVSLAAVPEASRDQALRDYFKGIYDFIEPAKVAADYDVATGIEKVTLDGSATLKWDDSYFRIPGSSLSYNADFARPAGPDRDAPFAVGYPSFYRTVTTIKLPPHVTLWPGKVGHDVDQTLAGTHYHRDAAISDGVLTLTKWEKALVPEVSAVEARAAQARMRSLNDEDAHLEQQDYVASDADLKALGQTEPQSASAYVDRGLLYLNRQRWAEAVADMSSANKLEPTNDLALANRAIAHFWLGEKVAAQADLDAASATNPVNAVMLRGRALIARDKGDDKAALAAFSQSLDHDPDNSFALLNRALLAHSLNDETSALVDLAKVLRLRPAMVDARLLRINIYRMQGHEALALTDAEQMLNDANGDSYAIAAAANTFAALGQKARALTIFDKAIATHPDLMLYLNRADVRSPTDVFGRRADIDAALKLEPTSEFALRADANFVFDHGNPSDAATRFTKLIALHPDDWGVLVRRGMAYEKAGNTGSAKKDLTAASSKAVSATDYNSLCWIKAIKNVALDSALEDCNRALTLRPNTAAYLDSRGLVNLRLGRVDASIADYDAALKLRPKQAASLYGRALAWARKGNKAKAAVDRAAAIAAQTAVIDEFKSYGLTFD